MDDGCCSLDNGDHLNDDAYYVNYDDSDDVYVDADADVDADGFCFVDLMQVTLLIWFDGLDLMRLHLVRLVRKTYQIQPSIVK